MKHYTVEVLIERNSVDLRQLLNGRADLAVGVLQLTANYLNIPQ